MSERSRTAHAATGRQRRRPALRVWALAALAALLAVAPGAAPADEILLRSGELIEGTIIDATRNTVVVRRAIGGMRQMPIRDIEEMRVDLVQGGRISGPILSWAGGVHRLRSGNEVVSIRGGRVLSRAPYEEAAAQPPPARSPQRQAEPAAEAAPPAASIAERPATEPPAAEKPAAETTAADPPVVESPTAEAPILEDTESAGAESPPAETPADESPPTRDSRAGDSRRGEPCCGGSQKRQRGHGDQGLGRPGQGGRPRRRLQDRALAARRTDGRADLWNGRRDRQGGRGLRAATGRPDACSRYP